MIPVETLQNLDLFKYLWIIFSLFWLVVVGVSLVLVYHWITYKQIATLAFRSSQLVYFFGIVFLFFLSFFFFIKL